MQVSVTKMMCYSRWTIVYRFAYACHAQNRSVIFQISNGSQTDIPKTFGGERNSKRFPDQYLYMYMCIVYVW